MDVKCFITLGPDTCLLPSIILSKHGIGNGIQNPHFADHIAYFSRIIRYECKMFLKWTTVRRSTMTALPASIRRCSVWQRQTLYLIVIRNWLRNYGRKKVLCSMPINSLAVSFESIKKETFILDKLLNILEYENEANKTKKM